MINPYQFVNLILESALKACGMYSLDAMYLMVCTAGVESKLTHIKQLPDGPALGLFQIEPATYADCQRYLKNNMALRDQILAYTQRTFIPDHPNILISDFALNALIARVKYWMQAEAIPSYKDPEGQAAYYEKYYNGSETDKTQEFVNFAVQVTGWINHEGTSS